MVFSLDLGLRTSALTFDSLYLDEAYQSMYESTGQGLAKLGVLDGKAILFRFDEPHSIGDVLKHFREVDPLCPPLYGILLNRWRLVFGSSDFALRSFSLVCSALANAALMAITFALFGPETALFAGLLQALSPFDRTYGQEVRMYSLELLLSLASTTALLWLLRAKETWKRATASALYAVSACGLINTHYVAIFTVAAQALYGLVLCIKRKDWHLLGWLCLSGVLTLVLWLPCFELFRKAAGARNEGFYVQNTAPVISRVINLWRMAFNWVSFLTGTRIPAYFATIFGAAGIMVALGVKQLVAGLRERNQPPERSMLNWYLVSWLVVPPVLIWILDIVECRQVLNVSRYLIATAPAVYIVCALGLKSLVRNRKVCSALLLVYAASCLAVDVHHQLVPQRRPWKLVAQKLEEMLHANELVVVSEWYEIASLDRYLQHPLRQIGLSAEMGKTYIQSQIEQHANAQSFVLVSAGEGHAIKTMLPPEYKQGAQIRLSHDVIVTEYKHR